MAASSIRFGPGSTQEVGMDFANMKAKNVLVITDKIIRNLHPMKTAIEALERAGIQFEVFDDVRTEPKDYSYGVFKCLYYDPSSDLLIESRQR